MMYTRIQHFCDQLAGHFSEIPESRKQILEKIRQYIAQKRRDAETVQLVYICTHNSRRSHFGQIWAQVASAYYKVPGISSFSGGTESTAFHANAIQALQDVGFEIKATSSDHNPRYQVFYDDQLPPITCFSKRYDAAENPKTQFAAIMTCSDAEENCPFIPGVELRIATSYDDPKSFDGSPKQREAYAERCQQIALETLYVFSGL